MVAKAKRSQKIKNIATKSSNASNKKDSFPAHINYLLCPTQKRFLFLNSFVKKNNKKKIIVIFSSCLAVKHYKKLFTFLNSPVIAIHALQTEDKRTSKFTTFTKADSGVLFCTNEIVNKLDIRGVHWIIQYDPPHDAKEFSDLIIRTSTTGGNGNTLLMLREEEAEYIECLKSHKITGESLDVTWSKVSNIQMQLEKLTSTQYALHIGATNAFRSYIKSYISHNLRDIFNPSKMDYKKVAKCFGLAVPPFVDIAGLTNPVPKADPPKKKKPRTKLVSLD